MSVNELAAYIDQSVLKPEFTQEEIRKYIQEGIDYGCKTVCVNPASVEIASVMCKGTNTGVCVVCDFPFGLSTTASKVAQAEILCKTGQIDELDIVANYGWIKSGLWKRVEEDIAAVCNICHHYGVLVKVIFETDAAQGRIKIKGSGGIRDQKHFFELIDMGIDRMGIGYRSTATVLGI